MPAVILLAYASLLTLALLENIRGPFFLEILESLKLDATSGGAFFAAGSGMAFVGSWLAYRLMRGRDPLLVMSFTSLVFAGGFALVALAPNYLYLICGALIFGWGYGTLNVLQNVIVCEAAPVDRRRGYLSGLQSMYGLAAWSAPLLAMGMRALNFDWRQVFLALALTPFLVGLLAWRFKGKVRPEQTAPQKWSRQEYWSCAGLALLLSIYLWGELSISTRLSLWLRTQHGFTAFAADAQLGLFFLLLLGGRLALAFVPLRLSNYTILMASAFSSAALYTVGLQWSPYVVAFCGLTLSPFYPVVVDQAANVFGPKAARAVGAIIGLGNLSIMAMHLSVGVLTDWLDLSRALHAGPLALLLAGLGLLWLRRRDIISA